MNRIDLHLHSHASDGQLSPTALVEAASAAGLDLIALTDHDTAAGVPEALAAARGRPIRVIPGIELSTREGNHEIHILGYFIDPESEALQGHYLAAGQRRIDRMHRMIERLGELGVYVEYEDVVRAAGPGAVSIGRPHLARALLDRGHIRTFAEAFDRYIGDAGSAFVETDFPTVGEAIELIRGAGGVAVWAHPLLEVFDLEIRRFAELGLGGVECFRPNTPPAESLMLEGAARSLGMIPTGGSDWHGPHRNPLGTYFLRPRDIPEFMEMAGLTGDRAPAHH